MNLEPNDFQYFRAFYKNWLRNPQPFLMQLIIEDADFKDYIVNFIPKSVKFGELQGRIFSISFELSAVVNQVRVFTSLMYPFEFDESIFIELDIDEAQKRNLIVETALGDEVDAAFKVGHAYMRDNTPILIESESVGAEFAIVSAQLKDVLITKAIDTDAVVNNFAITTAQIKDVLITRVADVEATQNQFIITGAYIS